MNRILPLLFAASIPILIYAQNASAQTKSVSPSYRPYVTGAQLVRDMKADPFEGSNGINRHRAMGYIEGVMDAFAGMRWCPAGKAIPHELNYDLVDEISRLDPSQLKGDAAALLVATLAAHYPCNQPGAKR